MIKDSASHLLGRLRLRRPDLPLRAPIHAPLRLLLPSALVFPRPLNRIKRKFYNALIPLLEHPRNDGEDDHDGAEDDDGDHPATPAGRFVCGEEDDCPP
jgi:hypothetical protein